MNVRRSEIGIVLLGFACVTGFFGLAYGNSTYSGYFNAVYPNSPLAGPGNCSVCHASIPSLNAYGTDFLNRGKNQAAFTSIASLDSDRDTFSNATEINSGTNPGDANSHPTASDTTPPTVTGFTIPATSSSLTVPITGFTATDNVGVAGYLVTESAASPNPAATGWSATAPLNYIFATAGAKTLYAWAKDAAGNVSSSLSASVTVTASNPPPPSTIDLALWTNQWLKVTVKYDGYAMGMSTSGLVQEDSAPAVEDTASPMSRDHESISAYLKITSWDSQQHVLQSNLYQKDSSGQWVHSPIALHFIDGTRNDFLCWSEVAGDFTAGFTARVQGKETAGTLKSGSLKTLGGYYFEIGSKGDGSGSQAFAGGQISINGSLVSRARVPIPDSALAQ